MSTELKVAELRQGLGQFCMLMYRELCQDLSKEQAVQSVLRELDNERAYFLSVVGLPASDTPTVVLSYLDNLAQQYHARLGSHMSEDERFKTLTAYDTLLTVIELIRKENTSDSRCNE